jgi:ATP-dependent RNA helicase RhlE
MLDLGFIIPIKRIVAMLPKARQTLLFSATMPKEIAGLAADLLRNPAQVSVAPVATTVEKVSQRVLFVEAAGKRDLLTELMKDVAVERAIVFTRTKHGADKIARKLKAANHSVAVLHANRSQSQRVEALEGFKSGKYEVMVATDIAARGIDVAGVSHVINYDIPANPEDYVHRIGRTGRAMAVGDAFTLTTPDQLGEIRDIERFIGQKVPQLKLEGFNYNAPPPRPALGYQGAAPNHGARPAYGQHSGPGQRPAHTLRPAHAPQSPRPPGAAPAPQNRPGPSHAYQAPGPSERPGGGATPPAPRKFGGLSRGGWSRRG